MASPSKTLILAGIASWNPIVFGAVALVCTVPQAIASWVLVERPMLRLKRRSLPGAPPTS